MNSELNSELDGELDGEPSPRSFIITLNKASCLTLFGLAVDLAAFFLLIDVGQVDQGPSLSPAGSGEERFFLAIALMYLGMLADAFDGLVARKLGIDSEFGRYLDGFVDVFNYLLLPNLALWRLGFSGPWAAAVLSIMVACGVLRLSKFNMIGNIQDEKGGKKYLGLPVFWSQLFFFPLWAVHAWLGGLIFAVACAATWLPMSAAFLYNRPFFKPKNPWVMAGILLGLSAGAMSLFIAGAHP